MSRQYFRELLAPVMTADQSSIAGTAEAAAWPVSPWSATLANQLQPGQIYDLKASGVLTSAASSPGTLTVTPRWGTTTGGTSLGASQASATLTTSQSNVPWWLEATLLARSLGATGVFTLSGLFVCSAVGITGLNFGGPNTTVDTTAAAGIFMGITLGSASDSLTTRMAMIEAVN